MKMQAFLYMQVLIQLIYHSCALFNTSANSFAMFRTGKSFSEQALFFNQKSCIWATAAFCSFYSTTTHSVQQKLLLHLVLLRVLKPAFTNYVQYF